APAAAAALGRPVLVGLGVPPEMGEGSAQARFRASEPARAGLAGRLGHAAGEVVVEALRRAGRGVTREALATALAGPPFETGSLPPLRLTAGARGGEGVRLFQVDAAGRLRRGPALADFALSDASLPDAAGDPPRDAARHASPGRSAGQPSGTP
ncbi:hypothetical protein, partial [Paracraurococcus ruber]